MSTTLELSPSQKFYSHLVNCNQCKRNGKTIISLCRVGEILELRAEMAPEESHRPKSFPFVARMFERVGTPYGEGTVRDRSIKASHMYSYLDETGTERWKTAGATIVGYEVETEDGERHYVRPYQIKSLRPKREQGHGVQSVSKTVGVGSIPTAPAKLFKKAQKAIKERDTKKIEDLLKKGSKQIADAMFDDLIIRRG